MSETSSLKTKLIENPMDDFTQMPVAEASEHQMVVLGDLHANALKLLHFLVKQNVVEISEENYNKFKKLYFKAPQDIAGMRTLINESIKVKENTPFLRFLGDELADRGQNDFYMLMLFKKLDEADVQFDINQSNHTVEFSLAHEKMTLGKRRKGYVSDFLGAGQARSLFKLNSALKAGEIQNSELNELVNIHQKHQTLISYSLSNNKKNITLYSHAPVDYKIVKSLANKFKTDYNDETPEDLAKSIQLINNAYLDVVKSKKLDEIINNNAMSDIARRNFNYNQMLAHHPLELMMWSRNYTALNRAALPLHWKENEYTLSYMHGHDSSDKNPPGNVTCLDSMSGKNDNDNQCGWARDHIGDYEIKNPVSHVNESVLISLDKLMENIEKNIDMLIKFDMKKIKVTESPELEYQVVEFQSKLRALIENKDNINLCKECMLLINAHHETLNKEYKIVDKSWTNALIKLTNYCLSYLQLSTFSLYTTMRKSSVNESYKNNVTYTKNKLLFHAAELEKPPQEEAKDIDLKP